MEAETKRLRLRWLLAAGAVERKLAAFAQQYRAGLQVAAAMNRPADRQPHHVASGRRSDWLLAALRVKRALMRLEELRRKAGSAPPGAIGQRGTIMCIAASTKSCRFIPRLFRLLRMPTRVGFMTVAATNMMPRIAFTTKRSRSILNAS
jgi:hypothetical protein